MQIIIKDQISASLKKDTKISIVANQVNYFVGLNGSGKSVTFSALAAFISEKLKIKNNWMTAPPERFLNKFDYKGFEIVGNLYHFTAKSRQSQWVDLDMALSSASSFWALHASEGMNNQSELMKLVEDFNKKKVVTNMLYIFDEIDGSLDFRAKHIFFDLILKKLRGTIIVCSHDRWFLNDEKVFDFSDGQTKVGKEFFEACLDKK